MADPELAAALRAAGARNVLTASDPAYPAVAPFDLTGVYTPDAVVAAADADDVAAAVTVASERGVPIAVFGTGHGAQRVTGGILVTTGGLAGVTVDPDARTARIGAGTTWGEVLAAITPHGLAALCGAAPGVGVVGYVLGGGLGPIARSHGFASDHVRAIEIVTPAGGLTTVTGETEPDLFWALRGGKGGFGVVTALTIDLLPIATVHGGALYFGADDAERVVRAFAGWAPGLPESAMASFALLRLPDVPALPEPLRGRFVVHVRFVSLDAADEAERQIAPIRAVATPLLDTVGPLPYAKIATVHADPASPMPVVSGSVTMSAFGPDAVGALLAAAGPAADIPVSIVEIRALGGAVAREARVPDAVGSRTAAYNLFVSGAPVPGLADTVIAGAVRAVLDAMAPWQDGGHLVNFVGSADGPDAVERSWTPEQNDRLDAIRAAADPRGLFPYARHGR